MTVNLHFERFDGGDGQVASVQIVGGDGQFQFSMTVDDGQLGLYVCICVYSCVFVDTLSRS